MITSAHYPYLSSIGGGLDDSGQIGQNTISKSSPVNFGELGVIMNDVYIFQIKVSRYHLFAFTQPRNINIIIA